MISWFYGDDRVRIAKAVERLVGEGEQLVVDAEVVGEQDFWARLMMPSMFAAEEVVVVKDVMKRPELHAELLKWASLGSPGKTVVFWDEKVDKRGKLYKDLSKAVRFTECALPKVDEKAVFRLFESALFGRLAQVDKDLEAVRMNGGEPVAVMALVSGQLYNLGAVVLTNEQPAKLAKSLGVHPFALSNLTKFRGKVTEEGWREMVEMANETDRLMKTAGVDAWLLLRKFFYRVNAIIS
ncbi:hypothetical protein FWH13_01150 [Candidatus Saccharibacteria bacterium]|nr:hypothetical protein [Candidatus Saccharibacteria bacterium]